MDIRQMKWHPRTIDLIKGVDQDLKKYDFDSLPFDTFCNYYLCASALGFKNVRNKMDKEFEILGKEIFIIPHELFTQLGPSMFSVPFAQKVWQTTPATVGNLVLNCFDYFPPSFGLLIAYVEALAFGKDVVAAQLKKGLKNITTLEAMAPQFLDLVQNMPDILDRLAELHKIVQHTKITEGLEVDEDIEKHDELNPKIFDGSKLKPEVREKAIEISNELIKTLEEDEIPFKLKDLVLTGSNASYNYTKDSDADIHLVADMSGIDDPDGLYPALFSAYKSAFNNKYNIDFYGVPVEVYIESADTPVVSNGIYSILNDEWIKEPKNEVIPDIDIAAIADALKPWEKRYKQLIKDLEGSKSVDETPIDDYVNDLYELRAKGLSGDGEYSTENLIFKEIRNKGYLDNLKELRARVVEQRLSIRDINEAYLDAEQKFWDYGTKELTDTDKIDTSVASNFGTRDLLQGNENYPDLVYDIVPMTADQYFKLCSIIQGYSPEILKQQISEDKYKLNHLQQVLQTHRKQFPLPYVCFDSSSELYGQEGKHRMFLLGQNYGWDKKFPVQVIQNKHDRLPIPRLLGEKMTTKRDQELTELLNFAGLL